MCHIVRPRVLRDDLKKRLNDQLRTNPNLEDSTTAKYCRQPKIPFVLLSVLPGTRYSSTVLYMYFPKKIYMYNHNI
jgi:hypothetical protein